MCSYSFVFPLHVDKIVNHRPMFWCCGFVLHTDTRLDVSVSQQMVFVFRWFSSFSEQYAGMGDLQDGHYPVELGPIHLAEK
jgi:hypothetical protein